MCYTACEQGVLDGPPDEEGGCGPEEGRGVFVDVAEEEGLRYRVGLGFGVGNVGVLGLGV